MDAPEKESVHASCCIRMEAVSYTHLDVYKRQVFKDFGYKGSDYRLKRSAETASHYTLGQSENCMQGLLELDQSLKSQPTDDQILLETALCRLAMAGSGR